MVRGGILTSIAVEFSIGAVCCSSAAPLNGRIVSRVASLVVVVGFFGFFMGDRVNVREQDKKKALRPAGRGCKPFPPALDCIAWNAKLTGEVNLSDVAFLHFR